MCINGCIIKLIRPNIFITSLVALLVNIWTLARYLLCSDNLAPGRQFAHFRTTPIESCGIWCKANTLKGRMKTLNLALAVDIYHYSSFLIRWFFSSRKLLDFKFYRYTLAALHFFPFRLFLRDIPTYRHCEVETLSYYNFNSNKCCMFFTYLHSLFWNTIDT